MINITRIVFCLTLLGLLAIHTTMTLAQQSTCYQVEPGWKNIWKTNEVRFRIDDSIPEDWRLAIVRGALAWNKAGANFRFKLDQKSRNVVKAAYIGPTITPNKEIEYPRAEARQGCVIRGACIIFNTHYAWSEWSTSGEPGKVDVQSVATHEFGHWVGLKDIYNGACKDVTMYWHIDPGDISKRTLEPADIHGIIALWGRNPAPRITDISIPKQVYGSVEWKVFFEDADGDVNFIKFEEFWRGNWTDTGSWNPNVFGQKSGSIGVRTKCNSIGQFRQRVTLYDAAGNQSTPYEYTLNCVQTVSSGSGFTEYNFNNESSFSVGTYDTEIMVYNLGGLLVFRESGQQAFNQQVPRRNLANGVYLAVITVRDLSGYPIRREVRKIVVLR